MCLDRCTDTVSFAEALKHVLRQDPDVILVGEVRDLETAAAVEIMLANAAVRNLIREGKIHQLPNTIRTHARLGMQSLDQALVSLYSKGVISEEKVLAFCNNRDEVERLIASEEGKLTPLQRHF